MDWKAIERVFHAFVETYEHGGRIFYVGAGTSGRIGVLDAAELPPTFGIPPERVQGIMAGGLEAFFRADESLEDDREAGRIVVREEQMDERDLVIGLTASGETPFVWGCLEEAKRCGITTVGITNNPRGGYRCDRGRRAENILREPAGADPKRTRTALAEAEDGSSRAQGRPPRRNACWENTGGFMRETLRELRVGRMSRRGRHRKC